MKANPLPHHIFPMATSSFQPKFRLVLDDHERKICSDRKGFFDHLQSRSLIISSLRISFLQASQLLTTYYADQIAYESSLDEDLFTGKISHVDFEIKTRQWEQNEWTKRSEDLLPRVKKALVKYHILIICMRTYEKVFEYFVSEDMMDKLTKDPFKSAIRKHRRLNDGDTLLDSNGVTSTYPKAMFETCIYSNAIAVLSDYTVQQFIMCIGYYHYIQRKRRQSRLASNNHDDLVLDENNNSSMDAISHDICHDDQRNRSTEVALSNYASGGIALSFLYKSCMLIVTKAFGLFMTGVGGSIGSMIRPGWGTIFGSQIGETFVNIIVED